MCVALPGRVIEIEGTTAVVDFKGNRVRAEAGLVCVKPGDSVLVHAGCILQVLSEEEGKQLTELFEELQAKMEANELSISAACRQMNIGAGTYYRMRDQYKKEHSVPNVPNLE